MTNESINYVRKLAERAFYTGAVNLIAAEVRTGITSPLLIPLFVRTARNKARNYTQRLKINEKALRCANSEEPENEERTNNLHAVSTTRGASAQLPPLAADLEGLAVSLGILAGKVPAEEWEFLKIFRANLRAAAERVAALENNLEVSREQD